MNSYLWPFSDIDRILENLNFALTLKTKSDIESKISKVMRFIL